jgi:hypothetical protein
VVNRKRAVQGNRDVYRFVRVPIAPHPAVEMTPAGANTRSKYSTISHTLPIDLVDHLRTFAHYQRVSASSVMEFALRNFFGKRDDAKLGAALRRQGAGPRRKRS